MTGSIKSTVFLKIEGATMEVPAAQAPEDVGIADRVSGRIIPFRSRRAPQRGAGGGKSAEDVAGSIAVSGALAKVPPKEMPGHARVHDGAYDQL
jgi:hypothetical protein